MQTITESQTVYADIAPVNRRLQAAAQRVFSFPVVLGALLVLLMMFTIRSRFSDPDMWWHLKTGEIIWNTHSIPRVDPFSFTAFGHPWVAQEWLSEVVMFGAWKIGGYTGLMLWFAVIAALLVIAAYVLCTLYSGNCKVAFLGGVTVWLFSTVGLAIRPHLIGYLLLICELIVIQLGRTRNTRWLLALPPLFAIWINFHSSYFLGLVVLGSVLVLSFVEFDVGLLASGRWPRSRRRLLTVAFGLSLVAPLANPIGPKLLWYPMDTMFNQPLNIRSIEEWQPTSFSDFRGIALLALGALVLLIPLLRRIRLYAVELALVSIGFFFAIRHERMLFIFGILVTPVLCRLLATTWEGYDRRRDSRFASTVMLALLTFVIVLSFPNDRSLVQQIDGANPVKALAFVRSARLTGQMLNEYIFGGYLIWAAPERKVSIDGRADLYEPAGVLEKQQKWALLQADPHDLLDRYQIGICMLSHNAPMTRVVPLLQGWKKVYSDDLATVFARQKQ